MTTFELNKYGLRIKDMEALTNCFLHFPEIERVILYGSRAKGNYQLGSDIDLAIIGKKVTQNTIRRLHDMLEEETNILLFFDVLHYETLTNELLKKEIDKDGIVLHTLNS